MKNDDVPISLFSFQDIVTSLTGIMVLVILVIALKMVDTVETVSSGKSHDPEYDRLVAAGAALDSALAEAQKKDLDTSGDIDSSLKIYMGMSIDALEKMLHDKQNEAKEIQDNIIYIQEQTAKTDASAMEEESKGKKDSKDRTQAIDDLKRQLSALQKANEKKAKQLSELMVKLGTLQDKLQYTSKTKRLKFAFSGMRTHTPLVIECTGQGFRASAYPFSDGVKEINNLFLLTSWLKKYSMTKYYPLLLYRRNAIHKMNEIEEAVHAVPGVSNIGKEPIDDDVVVFYDNGGNAQ